MLYVILIGGANVFIILGNILFFRIWDIQGILWTVLSTVSATAAVIAVDGVLAFLIRRLPEKWFDAEKKLYHINGKERKLYQKTGIKKWKDMVPELGGFTSFHKNKLQSSSDNAYLARFILESNYGIVIHIVGALLGFLILFVPICSAASIWVPVYCVNFVLNLMSMMVLRYNLPVLQRLYERSKKSQPIEKDA